MSQFFKFRCTCAETETVSDSRMEYAPLLGCRNTLISSLSHNHHVYADNTQLVFSFHPSNFDWSIIHLQNALHQISSWMNANLLTLSSSKTELLLTGLKKQLAKNITPHSTPVTLLATSALSLMNTSPFQTGSHLCYYHTRQLRCVRPYLDSKTASTFATSIVHSKLDYCNSLY